MPFLSFGKLRGSLGATGNDKLTDYQYLSTYSAYRYSYQGVGGLFPSQLTNPFFGWEKVKKLEAAFEFGFLKDRILLNLSWYKNRTDNQLVGYNLPYVTGFGQIQANLPAVIQNTGLEIELNTVNISKNNFSWNSSFNISIPRNKLIAYPNIESSSYSNVYAVGQPLSIRYRYVYTGIDPIKGQYTFEDKNKDGQISFPQDVSPVFEGQKFFGGLSNTFKYKNYQLDVFLSFVKQTGLNYLFNSQPGGYENGAGNQPKSVLNNKELQPFTQDYGSNTYLLNYLFDNSSGRYSDASYIRIKNVSLSYSIPERWKGSGKLKGGRIYLQCQNPFTITKYKGMDPETLSGLALPPLRVFTVGLQFTL